MLGVSLIHGQFRALAVVKGKPTESWVCPDSIESFDHLGEVLAEAVQATHFPGKRVAFLVEDLSCVHQYHLVPPMKTADMEIYLNRMADQEKACEGPAVWRYRKAVAGRGRTGFFAGCLAKGSCGSISSRLPGATVTSHAAVSPVSSFYGSNIDGGCGA